MAIIPSSTQFVGIAASVNLTEKKSSQLNSETQPYTMQDIIDTAGGGGTPAGTAGQIQFSDGSAFAADSNLFWDNTNKRLGVGTNTPFEMVQIGSPTNRGTLNIVNDALSPFIRMSAGNSGNNQSTVVGDGNGALDFQYNGTTTLYLDYLRNVNINTTRTAMGAKLGIKGSGSTSATTSLLVQNSSGSAAFQIKDDMQVSLPSTATNNTLAIGGQVGTSKNGIGVGYTFGGVVQVRGGLFNNPNTDVCDLYGVTNSVMSWVQNTVLFKAGNNGAIFSQPSALVSIDSTTQGFLPPRMTTTQKNAISTPAAGLMVYDTTTNKLCCYNGTSWNDLF